MTSPESNSKDLIGILSQLNKDRAWILEQIDQGSWPSHRLELAALERELGQLLIRVKEKLED
tara:strand:+ start:392 stop:577 length:186 start_codon:yes stop_codon:yes gene_type:complete